MKKLATRPPDTGTIVSDDRIGEHCSLRCTQAAPGQRSWQLVRLSPSGNEISWPLQDLGDSDQLSASIPDVLRDDPAVTPVLLAMAGLRRDFKAADVERAQGMISSGDWDELFAHFIRDRRLGRMKISCSREDWQRTSGPLLKWEHGTAILAHLALEQQKSAVLRLRLPADVLASLEAEAQVLGLKTGPFAAELLIARQRSRRFT